MEDCPVGYTPVEKLCLDNDIFPPTCPSYVLNGMCTETCPSGYAVLNGICYESCGSSCCRNEYIRDESQECILFDNQLHIVTPEKEK